MSLHRTRVLESGNFQKTFLFFSSLHFTWCMWNEMCRFKQWDMENTRLLFSFKKKDWRWRKRWKHYSDIANALIVWISRSFYFEGGRRVIKAQTIIKNIVYKYQEFTLPQQANYIKHGKSFLSRKNPKMVISKARA